MKLKDLRNMPIEVRMAVITYRRHVRKVARAMGRKYIPQEVQ